MFGLRLWTLVLGASAAWAFKDTSPFMLFSTSKFDWSPASIATSETISNQIDSVISKCSSDFYIVAHQPGVSSSDFRRPSTPHLRDYVQKRKNHIKSGASVSEVLGDVDRETTVKALQKACGAEPMAIDPLTGSFEIVGNTKPRVIRLDFPSVSGRKEKAGDLHFHDLSLVNLIDSLPTSSFTVFYSTSPATVTDSQHSEEASTYEMDHTISPIAHMDMKRDLSFQERADNGNITLVDGPLFERYQYLTPGLFMGGLAMFFILAIAFVGVSTLQSLTVSYAAFDKENGPAAQRKQQ